MASQDELTLNYTLADPSGLWDYGSKIGFRQLFTGKSEGGRELDEQLLEALKGIREKDPTGEAVPTYKILKEVLERTGGERAGAVC